MRVGFAEACLCTYVCRPQAARSTFDRRSHIVMRTPNVRAIWHTWGFGLLGFVCLKTVLMLHRRSTIVSLQPST